MEINQTCDVPQTTTPGVTYFTAPYSLHPSIAIVLKMKLIHYLLVFWSSLLALCQAQQLGICYSESYCYTPVAYSVTKDACFRSLYKGWSRYYSRLCETPLYTYGLCSYSFTCETTATIVNVGFTKYECCNIGTGVAWRRPTLLGLTCELCRNGLGHCYYSGTCTRTILDHIILSSVYIVPWTGTPERCYEHNGTAWQGYDGICYRLDYGECYYSFTCAPLLKVSGYYTKNECCTGGGTGWARVGQQCEPCPYQYACFPESGCSGGFLIAYNGSGGDRCCNSGGRSWIGASMPVCTPCSGTAVTPPADIHPPTLPTQPARGTLPAINQELPTHAETMPTTHPEEFPTSDETTQAPSTVPPIETTQAPSTVPPTETTQAPSTVPPSETTQVPSTVPPSETTQAPSTVPPTETTQAPSTVPPSETTQAGPSTVPHTETTQAPSTVPPSETTQAPSTVPHSRETTASTNPTFHSTTLPPSEEAMPSDEITPSGVDQGSAASHNRCSPATLIGILVGAVLLHMYY